jgi:hypothetical protein
MGNNQPAPQQVKHDDIYDFDEEIIYQCAPKGSIFPNEAKGMTYLMKLVLLTREHTEIHTTITEYIKEYPIELEKQNSEGWTPLTLAIANSNTCSTYETVKLLLDNKADVNGWTTKLKPLFVATYFAGSSSTVDVFFLICSQSGIVYNIFYEKGTFRPTRVPIIEVAVYSRTPSISIINYLVLKGCYVYGYSTPISIFQRAALITELEEIRKGNTSSQVIRTIADSDLDVD